MGDCRIVPLSALTVKLCSCVKIPLPLCFLLLYNSLNLFRLVQDIKKTALLLAVPGRYRHSGMPLLFDRLRTAICVRIAPATSSKGCISLRLVSVRLRRVVGLSLTMAIAGNKRDLRAFRFSGDRLFLIVHPL
jgi:hypothetical protein